MPARPEASGLANVTVVAIDWSGRAGMEQVHHIRAAVARPDEPINVWADLTRADVVEALCALPDDRVVVGFDFSFSYPAWVGQWWRVDSAIELWPIVERDADVWVSECCEPFFGRKGKLRPRGVPLLRRTEAEFPPAKSTFQINGPGAVGLGSLRGMPYLTALRHAGFAVWPFDDAGSRTIVEIYPTALRALVGELDLEPRVSAATRNNDNTRDAVYSASVMFKHRADFAGLRAATDATTRLEGQVWVPGAGSGRR
jgi:hypothetical protein